MLYIINFLNEKLFHFKECVMLLKVKATNAMVIMEFIISKIK